MSRIKHLNRIRKGVGIAIATPVVLFFILAILIYLPPVQSYVKDKATRYLSEKTGTEITIDNVRLYFPLDLNLNGTRAVQRPDTLLSAKTLRLGIRILPLFQGKIALDELFLSDTDVNTKNLISDTQIKGHIGLFDISIPAEYRQNLLNGMTGVGSNIGVSVPAGYSFYAKTGTAETWEGDFLYITGIVKNDADDGTATYADYSSYNGSYIIIMQIRNPKYFNFDFASQSASLYQGLINTVLS